MLKKINKKIAFRASLIFSTIITALFAGSKDDSALMNSLDNALPSVGSLFKVEKVYATDGSGDCSGSSDGGITYPADPPGKTTSAGAIKFVIPAVNTFSCGSDGGCFIAGTLIRLSDGSTKNIEDVTIEDVVSTSSGPQPVMRKYVIPYTGLLYAFNGSEHYFVSPSHPFMTSKGWRSIDPKETAKETPDLVVAKLEVGDEIIKEDGSVFVLSSLESKVVESTVYNFDVNDSHDYFADGLHVHNVSMKFIDTAEARQSYK